MVKLNVYSTYVYMYLKCCASAIRSQPREHYIQLKLNYHFSSSRSYVNPNECVIRQDECLQGVTSFSSHIVCNWICDARISNCRGQTCTATGKNYYCYYLPIITTLQLHRELGFLAAEVIILICLLSKSSIETLLNKPHENDPLPCRPI